jgi:hypothetical protein
MANQKCVVKDNKKDKRRAELALEINSLFEELSYNERMTVCVDLGIHEDTLSRYRALVAKIPTAERIVIGMKRALAERGVAAS